MHVFRNDVRILKSTGGKFVVHISLAAWVMLGESLRVFECLAVYGIAVSSGGKEIDCRY